MLSNYAHANPPINVPLQCLPPTTVDIALELSCNQTLNAALKPHLTKQRVVSLLVEEQLLITSERRVHFAVLVEVRSDGPSTVVHVQEEHHTLADMDEDSNLATAPKRR